MYFTVLFLLKFEFLNLNLNTQQKLLDPSSGWQSPSMAQQHSYIFWSSVSQISQQVFPVCWILSVPAPAEQDLLHLSTYVLLSQAARNLLGHLYPRSLQYLQVAGSA